MLSHRLYSPVLQCSHARQGTPGSRAMRSPRARFFTADPTFSHTRAGGSKHAMHERVVVCVFGADMAGEGGDFFWGGRGEEHV